MLIKSISFFNIAFAIRFLGILQKYLHRCVKRNIQCSQHHCKSK